MDIHKVELYLTSAQKNKFLKGMNFHLYILLKRKEIILCNQGPCVNIDLYPSLATSLK